MNAARIIGICFFFALTACGARDAADGGPGGREPSQLASLPVTLEGMLEITVTEGDAEEDGGAGEINFGVLTVGKDEYLIEVEEKTLKANSITLDEQTKVRATLGKKSEYGDDSYVITSLSHVN